MLDWAEKKSGPVKKVRDLSSSSSPAEGLRAMQAATEHEHASALDLDSGMRERLENHFGPMVSRVHFVQSDLPANFGAKALAQGDTVRVAPGAYTPGTASGEHLLSHELGHIVQQSRGQGMGGVAGMPMVDSAVESGADSIAQSAMSGPGLGLSAAPAAAASAPMLGLGLGARFVGFMRRLFMTKNQKENIDRLIKSRAWKVRMDDAQNQLNPTDDPKVAKLQAMIDEGITDDMSNADKVTKLQENFARVTGNQKSFKKGLDANDPDIDAEGLRQRMLNMCRTFSNFSGLRGKIGGLQTIDPSESSAMMSIDGGLMAVGGKSTINVNPRQTGVVENMHYIPKPDGPTTAEEERRRKDHNNYWANSKIGKPMENLTAGNEYAGTHELGHAVSYMATKDNYFMGLDSGADHKAGKSDNDILRKSIGHLLKREKNDEYGYSSTYGEAPKFQDYFGDNVNRTSFGANDVSEDEARNYANHTGFMARDMQNNGQEVFVRKPTYQKNLEKGRNAIGDDPETQAFWRESHVPLVGEPSTRTTPIFDPDRFEDTRSEGQRNLHKLYDMGETSLYGSSKPTESMAEAVAQVEAKGKGASRVGKQIYKRLWRQLNPDAAYWEYRLRQEKKKNKNIVSKYSKWQ